MSSVVPHVCLLHRALDCWIVGDLPAFVDHFHDDIEWCVHLDSQLMPYASSALGKDDLRWRLDHLIATFEILSFKPVNVDRGTESCTAHVDIAYTHRNTGETLSIWLRLTAWSRDGVIVRFEESSDAEYVAAFARYVHQLEAAMGRPSRRAELP
jgi:ketosteroid isomerase-like protein